MYKNGGNDMINLSRFSLEGKVALVTGASRGIGRAAALGFAEAGADVALASRKKSDLDKVAEEVRAIGRKALPVAAHLGRMDELRNLVDNVMKEFGRIDILVNNAGTSPARASCLETEERLWDSIMNLNLKGLYFLSQAVARIMKRQGGGKIINVASTDGYRPEYHIGIYSITKAAVIMVTKSMAFELAQYNIRVNAIAPGSVLTRVLEGNWASLPEEQANAIKKFIADANPMKRIADPDEITGAMIYLASDASSFTTGETILIDGGLLLGIVPPE
jgi:NAD(P)-dependent dehydrogenase (short-subunit alcohol dehydrogenase family)